MSNNARLVGPTTSGLRGYSDGVVQSLIDQFIEGVRDAGEKGVTRTLIGRRDPDERVWPISLRAEDELAAGEEDRPDFHVAASLDTMQRMLEGSYAPLDAFRDGKLRVSGGIPSRVTASLFAR